jgi:hypothetical protein
MRTKPESLDGSPAKLVLAEVDVLRAELRGLIDTYAGSLEAELERIRSLVESSGRDRKLSGAMVKDLRDMLTLLSRRQIKPERGRRKDLKRVEGLIRDLGMLIENW